MVRPNKHALAHAVDSWHLCQKQYQFFLRLYVFLFFFLFFLSFFFFSTLHHYAYSDREAGTMGPAFIESYIIDNRKNDSQIRYIGDDSSISFSPRSNVTTILSLSLCSPGERTVSSGSDAFRAFSFCLPFFHLPRDASQFPLPLNRRRRRRRRSRRRLLIRFFI